MCVCAQSGEGNGKPLQCSCLEDPRGGRAWWAAVYGVTLSRKRLQQLSSSSNALSRVLLFATPGRTTGVGCHSLL